MQKKPIIPILLFLLTILLSCAHEIPPSGGPEDKIGPKIINSTPKIESINVPVKSHIVIVFSEWLSTKSDRGVSVFPPLKIKTIVHQNHIEIIPITSFAESTTYHITINSLLQDLHNNPIISPSNLVFSTGNSLDSGTLSGCVIDPTRKALQPKIALFRNEHIRRDSGFTATPDYLMQTDSAGRFDFSHLKNGNYHIVGFLDEKSTNRIQADTDHIYIPTDSSVTINNNTKPVILFPAIYDTITPQIQIVKALSSTLLSGQWTSSFDIRNGFNYPQCTVERVDSTSAPIQGNYIPLTNEKIFTLVLKSPLKIAPYRLIYKMSSTSKPAVLDTIRFNGVPSIDTLKPVLQSWTPSGTIDLDPSLKLIWSKPVIINAPLFMTDSTGDTIICKAQSGYSDTTSFSLQKRLSPGKNYRIVILNTLGNDLAGNNLKLRDSTDTTAVIQLQTITIDSLALSLQGGAPCLQKDLHRKWIFKPLSGNASYIARDNAGQFKFDSIPSGKGQLFYFDDLNNNNKPDPGRLSPWIAPEAYFGAPDTVEARARWEVEGIDVHICEPCERKVENSKQ